jgi:chromosome partitioning protein
VIAVANLKGGVGKTTTSVYLAGAAKRMGYEQIALVDADPQASASEWLEATPIEGVDLYEAPTARLVSRALDGFDGGLVVVDTPPGAGDEKIVRAVLERTDVVVIPTRAGGTEPSRVSATLELLHRNAARGIVICSARTGTRDLEETIEIWTEAGEEIWGTIPERVAIASGPASDLSIIGISYYEQVLSRALKATGQL